MPALTCLQHRGFNSKRLTNSTESIDSLQAAHGNEPECDELAPMLTDNSPELMISPDVELTERSVPLSWNRKGYQSWIRGRGTRNRQEIGVCRRCDCFRAGIREDDPPADVPAMCVRLNQDQYLHVYVREALLRKKQSF